MNFLEQICERAKKDMKTIVLPESEDIRTIKAAAMVQEKGIANIILVGVPEKIHKLAEGLDISKCRIVNPETYEKFEEYANAFYELRKAKGMTQPQALAMVVSDHMYFACMMVKCGDADGVVSGACHSSANTLRPSLQIIKTKPGSKLVSAFFVVCVNNKDMGANGVFVMGDCGLNQNPNPTQLADIAASSAESFEYLVGKKARVAMLSHSSYGSAAHNDVDKVVEATAIAKKEYPQFLIDGELQTDAALIPEIAEFKAPGSPVAGKANVLVFPDLDAGNIGYKLLQRLGGAEAYGPLCQGIAKPINDLSRGCSAMDIVGVVAITAVQAQIV